MKTIRQWKEEVQRQKKSSPAAASSTSASNGNGSSNNNNNSSTPTNTTNVVGQQKKFVANGPRNAKNDGVKTDLYENRTRNGVIQALYNGLCIDSEHPPNVLLKLAKEIEAEVFHAEKFDTSSNTKYAQRLRSLTSNLRQKNNPELRNKINNGDLLPKVFINMSPREMAPESLKKELEEIKKKNLFNAQGATQERAVTDRFTCGKCKEKKVSYYQLQTRSADEPLTTFCTCENCGNRWKFS
ncbi:Transcription elongation factor [Wickerhamomyces ciferrii]|uniref:Transcription elongation factor n=1 Tax=Wickerhamomyces ciferrii (strain ATCC 14091 / BCRC 22168 / CBS 111 / JCM 3599 / NBRC 0793 / NRRL Y-1031 F-60-10) TaxID=1206466 RepID=K0K7K4_WICCF|nr:Transcription elongation factor [Wickerhamomyces ciferrii]CCH40780.1 Transcription elongation factor [Wickerhamomyces ciferrii]